MRKIAAANWKMNPGTPAEAVRLARASDKKGVLIAPPFVFLDTVRRTLKKATPVAQNAFFEDDGAWTGETSLRQLKSLGVRHVILGHSERRKLGETDEEIGKKVAAAFKQDFSVILCVGEHWNIRKKGKRVAYRFVKKQLLADLAGVKKMKLGPARLTIAYEPIWAIGTGKNDDPEDAAETSSFIKEVLAADFSLLGIRVLYGGSVNGKNVAGFLRAPEIDGVLVGGASLKPADFKRIIAAAEK